MLLTRYASSQDSARNEYYFIHIKKCRDEVI
jgi:hypothetical protein